MTIRFNTLSQIVKNDRRIITVGTFDGVHVGHLALVNRMVESRTEGAILTAVTFDPHPREVLSSIKVPKLSTMDERIALLGNAGIDEVVIVPFDQDIADLPAETFLSEILKKTIGFHAIVVGHDHRFGKNGEGDETLLRKMSKSDTEFQVHGVEPVYMDGQLASSSNIRRMLADEGDVEGCAALLSRPYQRSGIVVRGDGRGRTIGFPTANLGSTKDTIVPHKGVYAVLASGAGLNQAPSVMNIGIRPTFGGTVRTEEVHVLDWDGDLYEQELTVEFVDRLRSEKKFDSVEALVNQLEVDVNHCRQRLSSVSWSITKRRFLT